MIANGIVKRTYVKCNRINKLDEWNVDLLAICGFFGRPPGINGLSSLIASLLLCQPQGANFPAARADLSGGRPEEASLGQ